MVYSIWDMTYIYMWYLRYGLEYMVDIRILYSGPKSQDKEDSRSHAL